MAFFVVGLLILILLVFAGNAFVQANPAELARRIKLVAGSLLVAAAVFFALTGRFMFAVPVGVFGLSLLGLGGLGRRGLFSGGSSQPSGGQRSRVRSAMLEMELDHDTGDMTGHILAGQFQGRDLGQLTETEMRLFWRETAADAQSRALVEAYLDRRFSGWREDFEADGTQGEGSAPSAGPMTDEEAYQILGLSPGAGDPEIRAAHRRLMKRLHPDHGGTTFLAAKLNEAKDRLLRRH
ncbi:molecular chaperone DnaJ [Roseibium aquae]|uniref:Molecular chaperone DnaJ n=1 Tax=Roseibium aquae TaxID=1323746 RepID=A0A916TM84_9HYPH|nr:DnaJ domain-containing protein [Roseibium aquae]GGB58598.1 molecular chaperone DnaJ [Roseibium aquae]